MVAGNQPPLQKRDVVRLHCYYPETDTEQSYIRVVSEVECDGDEYTLSLVGVDCTECPHSIIRVDTSGDIYFEKTNEYPRGFSSSVETEVEHIGVAPDNFGSYFVQFRNPKYCDHIVQKTLHGYTDNCCKFSVDTTDGVLIPVKEVSDRQAQLVEFCSGCGDFARQYLDDDLPEFVFGEERGDIVGEEFRCPKCGDEPAYIEHDSTLHGMVSHHDNGQFCGPWDPTERLDWRVQT